MFRVYAPVLGLLALAVAGAAAADPCETWSGGDREMLINHAPQPVAERFRRDSAAYFDQAATTLSRVGGSVLVSVSHAGTRWYFVFDYESYAVQRRTLIYDESAPRQDGQIQDGDATLHVCTSATVR